LEYNPHSLRAGGPPGGSPARGTTGIGSTVNQLETALGGLFNVNDGMRGLRLHVEHVDNTIDIRTVLGNTATAILPTMPFSQAPAADAVWYVGGIPAFWKSWYDHGGDPSAPKTLMHMHIGYGDEGSDTVLYYVVSAGDFNTGATADQSFSLNAARAKAMMSITARWFAHEFTNPFPDESFVMTWYHAEMTGVEARQA
jgi:hypothetical protein